MSYILEALRKADAERERGAVPDLHAQLMPPGATELLAEAPRTPVLPWLAVGALLAIVAGGTWYFVGRDEAVTVTVAAAPVAPPVPPVAASAPVSAAASAASAAQAAASAASAAPAAEPAAPPPKRVPKAAPPQPKPVAKAAPPQRPPPAKAAAPAPKAEAPVARLPSLNQLPGDLRQQVPPLVIGGSVYSPQASARMVVVNGQVFQEGSNLAPELKLEQIRQKAAVFSIRGQLFEVPF